MNDRVGNYWIFCLIDNNIVKMVSNVLTGASTEQVLRNRRKPRLNKFNKKHIKLIWGDQHRKKVQISQIINDYNCWILGVDVVNQLIAYYRPKQKSGIGVCGCPFFFIALIFYESICMYCTRNTIMLMLIMILFETTNIS